MLCQPRLLFRPSSHSKELIRFETFFLLVKCHLPFSSFICLKKLCVRDSFEPSRILVFIKAGQNCNLSNQTNQHFVFSFLCPENVYDLVITISLFCIGLQQKPIVYQNLLSLDWRKNLRNLRFDREVIYTSITLKWRWEDE